MHKSKRSNTAIIYFSLSPWKEAQQKSFVSGKEFYKNFRIAALLRTHSRRQIDQTGLPYFVFDEKNQEGVKFGEKLVSAFEHVYREGYEHAIVVGNDTPRLESSHISDAADQLEGRTSDIVIGPATDGGTWLMGFSRDVFDSTLIQKLPWNTDQLLDTIVEQFSENRSIFLLETFADLDNEKDLLDFIQVIHPSDFLQVLKKTILSILEVLQVELHSSLNFLKSTYLSYNFLLRGPPVISDNHS